MGGNGGIGAALCHHYLESGASVWAVSHRAVETQGLEAGAQLDWLNQPQQLADWLYKQAQQFGKPELVISCCGFLHNEHRGPEKQLKDVSIDFLQQNLQLNCYSHVLLAQCLQSLYTRKDTFKFAALSAKVGSTTDNKLGGWYSYRISKAALNMFIKTLSIEWHRTFPNAVAVAVHPGTTDTDLSKPFQKRIADDKLYSPQLTANRLALVFEQLSKEQTGQLLFWDGEALEY